MLKVWGRKSVANVQKVLWCLGELAIPFGHDETGVVVSSAMDDAYLDSKVRPVVPVMDDEGFVLWEGNAIARYLAEKHDPGGLWPDDPRARAEVGRWMDYQLSTVRVHIHPLMREMPDADEVAYHSKMLAGSMQVLEAHLATQPYLVGEGFTVGDIPLGVVTYRWMVLDIDRPTMPNVEAWYQRLWQRPAFRDWLIPPEESFTPVRDDVPR